VSARRRHDGDVDTGSFSQTGGARIGWWNASFPFATISGDADRLCLSSLGRELIFFKGSVDLSRYRGFISTGLRFEHNLPAYPKTVVFWVWRFAELKEKLVRLGYSVRE
jgi:hypothetical protein